MEWSDAQTAPSAAKPVHFNTSLQVALQTLGHFGQFTEIPASPLSQSNLPPTGQSQKQVLFQHSLIALKSLLVSSFTHTHTQVPVISEELLEEVGAEPQGCAHTQLHEDLASRQLWQIPKLQNAAIHTME